MNIFKHNKKLKNFYILQLGQFISEFGNQMTSFGLVMWAYEKSGSVLSTSALTVCWLLPSVLLSFFAGSFIDLWNKKKIILAANAIATIFSVMTLILLFSNRLNISYLYVINFVLGAVNAFQDPALNVVVSQIVPKEFYTKIGGIRSFTSSFNTIFAPITATFLYILLGMKVITSVDLCTFIFAFVSLLLFVHIPEDNIKGQDKEQNKQENNEQKIVSSFEQFVSNCTEGLNYIVKYKGIFHLIIYMWFVNFIAAIYNCNFTPMILSRNGNNKFELGIVSGTIGVAGICGSILVTIMKEPKKRVPIIINTMLFSFLCCNGMLGIGRNFYVWTIAVFLGNCSVPFLTSNVEYIMRTKIPLEMQGRVFAARNTMQYISIPIGYILGGILTDKVLKPFMNKPSGVQRFLTVIVGNGKGAGNALIYVVIALMGFAGCCFFKFDKYMKSLDDKTVQE
jgi:DHA3 family macrolide efflux protein-like MFS transporter